MKLSVVVPTYNEEDNVRSFYERCAAVADKEEDFELEIVFVDDRSTDRTPEILKELRAADPRVHIIRFARNCGSHSAAMAGILGATGDAAVLLAADLQDPPELIPELLARWRDGVEVVWAVRKERRGEDMETVALSRLYYAMMNALTDVRQPPTGADVFLADRKVIEAMRASPEKNTSIYMLITWLGFRQGEIEYTKEARQAGESKWTFAARLRLVVDSTVAFSYVPIRFMSLFGIIAALLGLGYGGFIVVNAIFGVPVSGWSSLMVVVLVVGGIQMLMLGVLGEYVWRGYDESRGRPRYVIDETTLPGNRRD